MPRRGKDVSLEQRWLVVERLSRFLESQSMMSRDFARRAGMPASDVSSFKTGSRGGKRGMNRIVKGLDTLGAPSFESPVQGFPMMYDLVPTMKSVVESGRVTECTLPELLFMATLLDRKTFGASEAVGKHEIKFGNYVNSSFDLMPLMQVIVSSAGVDECTLADLIRYLPTSPTPVQT